MIKQETAEGIAEIYIEIQACKKLIDSIKDSDIDMQISILRNNNAKIIGILINTDYATEALEKQLRYLEGELEVLNSKASIEAGKE